VSEKDKKLHTISELGRDSSEAREEEDSQGTEPESVEELKQALAAKTEELKSLQDKYLRLAAEFDNYKRLSQREQRDYARFANESLLKELLPIIDNLERAALAAKESQGREGLIQGVELILKQFMETLAKFGVRPIPSVGKAFDPSRHQAVARVESNTVPPGSVVEEMQRGYYLNDRVLRAAMVTVAAGKHTNQESASEGPEEAASGAPN
jgi:molecular chaperone GrpE